MQDPFTTGARRSITLAVQEAEKLGHRQVGTEHLLMGIVAEGSSKAAGVLHKFGVILQKVRKEVEKLLGEGKEEAHQEVFFSPEFKQAMELAFERAKDRSHEAVTPEDLLLGVMGVNEGAGVRLLANLAEGSLLNVKAEIASLEGEQAVDPPRETASVAEGSAGSLEIDAEHLLLGIVTDTETDPAAARILENLGVNLEELRMRLGPFQSQTVGGTAGRGDKRTSYRLGVESSEQQLIFSARAKKVIEFAFEEARSLYDDYAGPEHILLGLLREGGESAKLLEELGVDMGKVRAEIIRMRGGGA